MAFNPIEHDICSKGIKDTLYDSTETTTRFSKTTTSEKLAAPQARVEASWQLDLVTNNRAKRPLASASTDERPKKYQKSLRRDRVCADSYAETTEDFNRDIYKHHPFAIPQGFNVVLSWGDIETVQDSYRAAIRDGRLKYNRQPQLAPGGTVWDPYILPQTLVRRAKLDNSRVKDITQRVDSTMRIVPKAVEWMAKTQEYNLTPDDVKEILQKAFVCQESPKSQPERNDKLPPILEVAAKALRRAKELGDNHITSRRVVAVLRMVAYALIEVSVVAKEATTNQIDSWLESLAGGRDWLGRSRCFVRFWCWVMANSPRWKGRELQLYFILVDERRESTLRKLFQAAFPAGAGEFVLSLSSEVYWKDLPALTRLPSLIEIVMVLVNGYVKHKVIGSALGCPVSHLEDLDPNLFSEVCVQGMMLYKPNLLWQEATGETGQEDQTKQDDGLNIYVNADPCISSDYDAGKDFDDLFCANFNIFS